MRDFEYRNRATKILKIFKSPQKYKLFAQIVVIARESRINKCILHVSRKKRKPVYHIQILRFRAILDSICFRGMLLVSFSFVIDPARINTAIIKHAFHRITFCNLDAVYMGSGNRILSCKIGASY